MMNSIFSFYYVKLFLNKYRISEGAFQQSQVCLSVCYVRVKRMFLNMNYNKPCFDVWLMYRAMCKQNQHVCILFPVSICHSNKLFVRTMYSDVVCRSLPYRNIVNNDTTL